MYAATHLFEHFSEEGHHSFLEDVSITLIEKTDPSNPLQRENYWRSTLKTMVPWGLNVEDCVWNSVLLYSCHWISSVIRTWFTELILVPIIIVSTFISIIVVAVFITLLFFLLHCSYYCIIVLFFLTLIRYYHVFNVTAVIFVSL